MMYNPYKEDDYENERRLDRSSQSFHRFSVQTPRDTSTKRIAKELREHAELLKNIMQELEIKHSLLSDRQKIDIYEMKLKIKDIFNDIDFVKQICYENDITYDEIKFVVVYDDDSFEYRNDVMDNMFFKLEDQFPGVYMEWIFLRSSEIVPKRLENTSTVFKRD